LIDGERLLRYLRGEPAGLVYLGAVINPMVSIMMRFPGVVHFIITKWDLFDDFGGDELDDSERLALARDALMKLAQFKGLVNGRRPTAVRLIPVSAVGREFVALDEAGRMIKRSGGRLKPLNIEIPFYVVVPDLLDAVERELDRAIQSQIASASTIRPAALVAAVASSAVRWSLRRLRGRRPDSGYELGPSAAEDLVSHGHHARVILLRHLRDVINDFESRLPSATLTDPADSRAD
jgi:hypothetical protein